MFTLHNIKYALYDALLGSTLIMICAVVPMKDHGLVSIVMCVHISYLCTRGILQHSGLCATVFLSHIKDGIPFDGRDVWQFVLVANDRFDNIWRLDHSSFVNLGRNCRPRCWPWSNDNVLPYPRSGKDKPLRGQGPNGK